MVDLALNAEMTKESTLTITEVNYSTISWKMIASKKGRGTRF
jgi:hypothetical protein